MTGPASTASDGTSVPFEKWHGLGNDFVVVEDAALAAAHHSEALLAERSAAICDRRRGVGADGILIVRRGAPDFVRVINADGSEPEMCGNGVRCVAAFLAEGDGRASDERSLGIGGDVVRVATSRIDRARWTVSVEMGRPSFEPSDAGFVGDPIGARPAPVGAADVGPGYVVSVGNPHWIFLELPETPLSVIGPTLERDERFGARTNVEFVQQLAPGRYRVDVWERGCGITQACGSGATAVAALLVRLGRESAGQPISVELPGGELTITVDPSGMASMRGPAEHVFDGVLGGGLLGVE